MRIPKACILAILSPLNEALLLNPTWIMTSRQNVTGALQLSNPILDQPAALPDNQPIYFTPSRPPLGNGSFHIPGDIWPSLPYPGFWTCPRNTALPPNTDDCLQVITNTYEIFGNTTVDVPADRCIQASYRSCLMYTCSSSCGEFKWNMLEWHMLAMHLQNSCIWGRGGGGYLQRLPGGKDGRSVYRTGLTHVNGADRILTPAIVC
ncbi:hypothetical protein BU23DRAFT_101670 [Bimuria novae-zelandiae CBS 107.79]|uniref:Uncharacterized protein n=1 Tax=Bimuria novae-zelandiae CBS 107.79 TaxID=1447943 RepID=A0A6A5VQL1_9PLEO|nr:hypothetical protein BU23DRAFT_101670 [Bimuria novae-zelandiae CBS 107.79]